ncbi:Neuronal acetylcholine receptor subunit alpha-10 [Mizuhopecten yessoensis]|uniref:Neuronal acetylcholine receptor subunit alpha-10 n=1 Tax=Mizuhopecten yessoensis TaxID=6573 RepID=A0A210QAA6_MIZYE|nr:Neuronal acetylcholine receptor subunit alpha-10 [Mizuhopecten yessoensis]
MEHFLFMIVTVLLCSNVVGATTMGYTKLLLRDLFQNYSKDIRPVEDQSKAVTVNMNLDVVSINDFDEVAGTISVVIILYISWTDESLVWNSTSYGNTTVLTITQRKIWLPKMFLCNPADSFLPIASNHFKVKVIANGTVLWTPGALLKATCTPDVSNFPFDQQTCTLSVSPWGYSSKEVILNIPSSTVFFSYFYKNTEWDVIGSATMRWSESFDIAYYYITIKRRHMNFIVSVVIPIIMLAFVNPFVFILPFDSGERASYSITVLLAFTVYMTVVSDRMPASSEPMSFISYYLLTMVGISVTIVTMNIFQMRTYSKNDADEPIPEWVRKAYMHIQNLFRGKQIKANEQYERPAGIDGKANNRLEKKWTQPMNLESSNRSIDIFYASILPVSQVKEKVKADTVSVVTDHQPEVVTWHLVAKIVDKFYFVLFLVATVFATSAYFITVNLT